MLVLKEVAFKVLRNIVRYLIISSSYCLINNILYNLTEYEKKEQDIIRGNSVMRHELIIEKNMVS